MSVPNLPTFVYFHMVKYYYLYIIPYELIYYIKMNKSPPSRYFIPKKLEMSSILE